MQKSDVFKSIIYEIDLFKLLHNGTPPEKIFISSPLYLALEAAARFKFNLNEEMRVIFHGIPVQRYSCEEPEFYLAERKGSFRSFHIELNQILRKEDDTK